MSHPRALLVSIPVSVSAACPKPSGQYEYLPPPEHSPFLARIQASRPLACAYVRVRS